MSDLLVIVPSRGRPGNVRKVLEAWDATDAWTDAALMVAVDNDDPEIGAYFRLAAERVGDDKLWWLRECAQWQPMVPKLDAAASAVAREYWALGFAGDDHLPRTPGWARRYLDELRELGTGIVYADDGIQGRKLPTQWAMTADIVRALGRMVPAPVEHLYCDDAILQLGAHGGCIRYLSDVLIEHMHPVAGKAPLDDQYRRVNAPEQYVRDSQAYQRWVREQLNQDAATVRALREAVRA